MLTLHAVSQLALLLFCFLIPNANEEKLSRKFEERENIEELDEQQTIEELCFPGKSGKKTSVLSEGEALCFYSQRIHWDLGRITFDLMRSNWGVKRINIYYYKILKNTEYILLRPVLFKQK